MKRGLGAMILASGLALSAGGCGKLSAGGEGSETHWLLKCDTDADCDVGQCLCGVCTLSCASLRDCPAPLDECSGSSGACESAVCGSSVADSSSQALAVADPHPTNRYPTCDGGRQAVLTKIDVGSRPEGPPPVDPAELAVPDYPSGFLFFGGITGNFYRVAGNGDFVRELPPPLVGRPDLTFDDVAALEDGSLLLAGRDGDQAWVGKVDAAWNAVWGSVLDTPLALDTDISPLPDGGVAVLVFTGTRDSSHELIEIEATDVHWARLSSTGEVLWQKERAIDSLTGLFPDALATTNDAIHVAFPQFDGYYLEASDLDGNTLMQEAPHSGGKLRSTVALPDGRLAVLSTDQLTLHDSGGNLVWEYSLSDNLASGADLAFDPLRNELLVVGDNRQNETGQGAFMGAVDLAGTPTWTLRRESWPPGPTDNADADHYGWPLDSVAVDSRGNAVGAGGFSSGWLSMMWVGAKACGG